MGGACPSTYILVHRHEQKPCTGHTIPQTQASTCTLAPTCTSAEMQNSHMSRQTRAHHPPQLSLAFEPKCVYSCTPAQTLCACTQAQRCNRTHMHTHFSIGHTQHVHVRCVRTAGTHANTLLPKGRASSPTTRDSESRKVRAGGMIRGFSGISLGTEVHQALGRDKAGPSWPTQGGVL